MDLGIDLGSANTVVSDVRRGIVFDEPSVMLLLQGGGVGGHADHGADGIPHAPSRPRQDRSQVQPGELQIRDHPVVQRPDRGEAGRGATEQIGRIPPEGLDLRPAPAALAQQHDARLVEDDAAAGVAHHGVGGAQVDAEIHDVDSRSAGTPVWGCRTARSMLSGAVW